MSLYIACFCAETLLRQKCGKQKMPQTYVKKVIYPYHKL